MDESVGVKSWYNSFTGRQVKTGVNLRHYTLINELISGGLKRSSSVLEVGCGVGTLTSLLHPFINRGKIVAADISDQSVAIASERFAKSQRVEFIATDVMKFQYPAKFDYIVLADVIEHIPVEQHRELFKILASHMHDSSMIFINIPHPQALDYARQHNPGQLQIIDQSIGADRLMDDVYHNDLTLVSYKSYSLFDREYDYAMIWLRKKGQVTLDPLPKSCIIRRKTAARVRFFLSKF